MHIVQYILMLAILIIASSCGGDSDSDNTDVVGAFVGTWIANEMPSIILECNGTRTSAPLTSLSTDITWAKGTDSDLRGTLLGCDVRANVSAKTATALQGQSCELLMVTATFATYAFTLAADDRTATDTGTGTATSDVTGACAFTEHGQYTKR